MEELFELLNKIYPMSVGLQDYLFKNLKSKKLKKKDLLVKKGHVNSVGSFVKTGLLHCYYKENGRKISSWFVQENKLAISVHSFFSQTESVECIEALEPSDLLYLTVQEMQVAYKTYLEFNYIIRELIQKYYILKQEHAYQLQRAATTRERFDWFLEEFPSIVTRVPMRHIASFLGVTEETLSRIRSQKS